MNAPISWLYPSRCALCSLLGDDSICETCREDFEVRDVIRRYTDGPLALSATAYAYEARVAQAVRRLKYSRATALAKDMALLMRESAERMGLSADLIVPIPIHWSRRCIRGFNQSDLLCEAMDPALVDAIALKRIRRTKPQAGLPRDKRLSNLAGAFRAADHVEGKSILLIDDVLTSGQTARECARALKKKGAREISILAFAGEKF